MLTSIKGYYVQGQVIFTEQPAVPDKTEVIVTFLKEPSEQKDKKIERIPGGLKGRVSIPDDFDEPLEDLKDYM